MRVVLDTNVLVSAAITPGGPAWRIVELWREGAFTLVMSEWILAELERVLGSTKIQRIRPKSLAKMGAFIEEIRSASLMIALDRTPDLVLSDSNDLPVVATAQNGAAAFLVTGDAALLEMKQFEGTFFVGVSEFVTLMEVEREHAAIRSRAQFAGDCDE